jgi:hypothetical protein
MFGDNVSGSSTSFYDRSRESEEQTEMGLNRHRLDAEVQIQIVRIYIQKRVNKRRNPSKSLLD